MLLLLSVFDVGKCCFCGLLFLLLCDKVGGGVAKVVAENFAVVVVGFVVVVAKVLLLSVVASL